MSKKTKTRKKKTPQKQKAISPDTLKQLHLAISLYQNEKYNDSKRVLESVLSKTPNHTDALQILGSVEIELGNYENAVKLLSRAIQNNPNMAEYHHNLGNAYRRLKKYKEAGQCYQKAIALKSDYAKAYFHLGVTQYHDDQLQEAIDNFEMAQSIQPGYHDAIKNEGAAFIKLGLPERAIDKLQNALLQTPDDYEVSENLALAQQMRGDFPEAVNILKTLINGNPDKKTTYLSELLIIDYEALSDEELSSIEELANTHPTDDIDHTKVCTALADYYDKTQDYDKAFNYYSTANSMKESVIDKQKHEMFFNDTRNTFTREFLSTHRNLGDTTIEPIFIVGMPRSGTTLTEQILSRHPDVFAAGELNALPLTLRKIPSTINSGIKDISCVIGIDEAKSKAIANEYIRLISYLNINRPRFTDKMPSNFMHIGLIKLIFPRAKIIHTTRNPLDNCFSMYTTAFGSEKLNYSNDLHNLAYYYKLYRKYMAHWEQHYHGEFYTISYEQLVNRQEDESKKLLNFCELSWDPSCLEFYKSDRTVTTASIQQVRKPIYKTSVNRWEHYEKHLQPLIDELAEYL